MERAGSLPLRRMLTWSLNLFYLKASKGEGKAIPLQAWTGHEGSRRLRLPDFKTVCT